jgi:hypothetical protein
LIPVNIKIFIGPLALMANDRMEICLHLNQNHLLNNRILTFSMPSIENIIQ